jgi:hypothetical protein
MKSWVRVMRIASLLFGVTILTGIHARADYITTFDFPAGPTSANNSANTVGGVSMNTAFSLVNGCNVPTFLSAPNPGNTSSWVALGITGPGVIVGQYPDSSIGTPPGFILNKGVYAILNSTDPYAYQTTTITNAQGINNQGIGVGSETFNGVNQHGFMFTRAGATTPLPDTSTQARLLPKGAVVPAQERVLATEFMTNRSRVENSRLPIFLGVFVVIPTLTLVVTILAYLFCKLPSSKEEDQAMTRLKKAIAAGYMDAAHIEKEKDLGRPA